VPVLPVSLIGVQELRWSRVLTLRRPRITIICGAPLYFATSAHEGSATARQKAFGDAIDAAWQELEGPYDPVTVAP
jgi:hypothetical protein